MEHLEQKIILIRQDIRDLGSKVDRNFLWTLGIIITMWVTVTVSIGRLYAI